MQQDNFPGNFRVPSKAMPTTQKVHHNPQDDRIFQPPRKRVFTEKELQAASASVKIVPNTSVSSLPIAATVSFSKNASTAAPTVDRKTRSQQDEEKQAVFREKIHTLFPDICEVYVKTLYGKYAPNVHSAQEMDGVIEEVLDEILEQPSYPKSGQKKRKRVDDSDLKRVQSNHAYYYPIVCVL